MAQSHHGAALDEDGFVQVLGRSIARHISRGDGQQKSSTYSTRFKALSEQG